MNIAILDDYQDQVRQLDCFSLLREHAVTVFSHPARGSGQLAVRLARFDAIILSGTATTLSAPLLRRLPKLRYIAQVGRLGEHLDLAAARALNIVIDVTGDDPIAPAELTWGLILAATRQIPAYASNLREGVWRMVSIEPRYNRLGRRLHEQRLGVWGYGPVGKLVAGYGKAFGMKVIVWGSPTALAAARADGVENASSKQALLQQADILSLHLGLQAETRGIISAADLATMKPTALLVNTSHADLIEPGALELALEAGRPGAAAIDLDDTEPLAAQTALLTRPNVLATPRIGALEVDSYERSFRSAFANLLAFAADGPSAVTDGKAI